MTVNSFDIIFISEVCVNDDKYVIIVEYDAKFCLIEKNANLNYVFNQWIKSFWMPKLVILFSEHVLNSNDDCKIINLDGLCGSIVLISGLLKKFEKHKEVQKAFNSEYRSALNECSDNPNFVRSSVILDSELISQLDYSELKQWIKKKRNEILESDLIFLIKAFEPEKIKDECINKIML